MEQPTPLYSGRDTARGEPDAEIGSISAQMPLPHFVLWGQRLEYYARAVGYKPGTSVECNIGGVCWPSDAFDGALLNRLTTAEATGDSFAVPVEGTEFGIGFGGTTHAIRFQQNDHGRIAGFELGPVVAPNVNDALAVGELVATQLQRSAALAGVPLRFALVRAATIDRREMLEARVLPYPNMPLAIALPSPFPVAEALLATLAEGRRNTSTFYRALVFFKIVEAFIDKLQPALIKTCHEAGLALERLDLKLPEVPFREVDPGLIGKSYTSYRSDVQSQIRDVIAHLDPTSPIVPFELKAESKVRKASIVLHYIATMIAIHVQRNLQMLAGHDHARAVTFTYESVDRRRGRHKKRQQTL